jgi:2-methylisocitrate lyase-like PEP mutase family enzyme
MMPKTPVVSRADLRAMGFKVVTYNVVLPAAVYAMQAALKALIADDIPSGPPMVAFDDLTSLVGLNDYVTMEGRYRIAE